MNRQKPEDVIGAARPFTGKQYLESLRDGREVYIYGERVEDVTTHPAFRNSARTIARLYDALHDPKQKDVLTCPTDTGTGTFTHRYFRVARSRDDLFAARDAMAHWARLSYGWMGRTPDYKAALMNTLGANFALYDKFADNAKRWYARAQNHVLFMNHAIVNPPVDRMKAADQVKDVFITIQKETDAGIYVTGAKVVATASALTHYNFLGQNASMPINDSDLAVMFIAPMNAPGVKLFCRASYEQMAGVMGTPFDYPLSSRFDENDAIFVFDNVLIPWEDVLVHRDLEKLKSFYPRSGFRGGLPVPGLHAACREARLPGRDRRQGAAGCGLRRFPRQPGDAGRDGGLAEPVLGTDRRDGGQSEQMGRRYRAAEHAVRLELPGVRGRSLRPHQGDRAEDRGLVADLSAVLRQGFQKSGDRALSRAIRARLIRHRLQGAHQDHEAAVGRHRHRIRWPPRALRDQLRRQSRGHPHPGARQRPRLGRAATA